MKFDQRNWLFRNKEGEVFRIVKQRYYASKDIWCYRAWDGVGDMLTAITFDLNSMIIECEDMKAEIVNGN